MLFLSFHNVGPGLQIQVVQLSGKCLYLLSNPTSLNHNLIHFSMKTYGFGLGKSVDFEILPCSWIGKESVFCVVSS